MEKVAVVTGANKGIGYGIVKGLCQKFDGIIYLTARDEKRGQDALKSIKDLNVCKHPEKLRFHKLDILDQGSIQALHNDLQAQHGGLDILINNAAIAFKNSATESFGQQAEVTLQTNYFALVTLCHMLFPLLRPYARVVNLSSSAGHLSNMAEGELKQKLLDNSLTEEQLSKIMNDFVNLAKEGKHAEVGWPNSAYSVSKIGVSKLSFIQHATLSKDTTRPGIIVNPVHPGYVDTDMTSHKGPLTIDEGAHSSLVAALVPQDAKEPRGQFIWFDGNIVNWDGPKPISVNAMRAAQAAQSKSN
uniref:carbonyl reductase (NADPH) n=1 Tax=Cacopsylla melanoneura TaxID=428564 RepID=A0A8D9A632_9HEMI